MTLTSSGYCEIIFVTSGHPSLIRITGLVFLFPEVKFFLCNSLEILDEIDANLILSIEQNIRIVFAIEVDGKELQRRQSRKSKNLSYLFCKFGDMDDFCQFHYGKRIPAIQYYAGIILKVQIL